MSPRGEWTALKHRGLNEFVDHIVSVVGRDQLKLTTECMRGVATYPKGDMVQGKYSMILNDLGNKAYDHAVTEVSPITLFQDWSC